MVHDLEEQDGGLLIAIQAYPTKNADDPTETRTVPEVEEALIDERKANGCPKVQLLDPLTVVEIFRHMDR